MRKSLFLLALFGIAVSLFAGFKVKLVKSKKPEQFQTRVAANGVTFAADLLLAGKDQKEYFHKELTPSNVIAVRLAIFNGGSEEVTLPLAELELIGPDGKQAPVMDPDTVAQAVLQGLVVTTQAKEKDAPVKVTPNTRVGDPRMDKSDPRYDPRLDPTDPSYDPNDPRNRGYGRNVPWIRPGVDVVLNPGGGRGGGTGDLSRFEKGLVEKDFRDKAHDADPILPSMTRDRFLYFSISDSPANAKGFTLRLPKSKGISQEIILKF